MNSTDLNTSHDMTFDGNAMGGGIPKSGPGAFVWLSDDAPDGICVDGRQWTHSANPLMHENEVNAIICSSAARFFCVRYENSTLVRRASDLVVNVPEEAPVVESDTDNKEA